MQSASSFVGGSTALSLFYRRINDTSAAAQVSKGLVWSSLITRRCGLGVTCNEPIRAFSRIPFKNDRRMFLGGLLLWWRVCQAHAMKGSPQKIQMCLSEQSKNASWLYMGMGETHPKLLPWKRSVTPCRFKIQDCFIVICATITEQSLAMKFLCLGLLQQCSNKIKRIYIYKYK